MWLTTSSFITPTKLSLISLDAGMGALAARNVLKSLPDQFNCTGLIEIQDFATSLDGTKIPYFLLCREDLLKKGNVPTVLYGMFSNDTLFQLSGVLITNPPPPSSPPLGYGGFEISMSPYYSTITGKAWLETGGCYVFSNIRGGGEYGPSWHKAALKEKRHLCYDDFISVAEDLIKKGVTSSARLAIYGGSNGGLLMGNTITRRPDLFKACICSVSLLDMRRYNHLLAGASWVAEYGDGDTDDWKFLQCYSSYHNIDPKSVASYPELFMFTSTRDDRMHPYHARSFVKRLLDVAAKEGGNVAQKFNYYENIESGYGGCADLKQTAYQQVLYFSFLNSKLRGRVL